MREKLNCLVIKVEKEQAMWMNGVIEKRHCVWTFLFKYLSPESMGLKHVRELLARPGRSKNSWKNHKLEFKEKKDAPDPGEKENRKSMAKTFLQK